MNLVVLRLSGTLQFPRQLIFIALGVIHHTREKQLLKLSLDRTEPFCSFVSAAIVLLNFAFRTVFLTGLPDELVEELEMR